MAQLVRTLLVKENRPLTAQEFSGLGIHQKNLRTVLFTGCRDFIAMCSLLPVRGLISNIPAATIEFLFGFQTQNHRWSEVKLSAPASHL